MSCASPAWPVSPFRRCCRRLYNPRPPPQIRPTTPPSHPFAPPAWSIVTGAPSSCWPPAKKRLGQTPSMTPSPNPRPPDCRPSPSTASASSSRSPTAPICTTASWGCTSPTASSNGSPSPTASPCSARSTAPTATAFTAPERPARKSALAPTCWPCRRSATESVSAESTGRIRARITPTALPLSSASCASPATRKSSTAKPSGCASNDSATPTRPRRSSCVSTTVRPSRSRATMPSVPSTTRAWPRS